MHIPDGFLSPTVWTALDLAAVPSVGWLARKAQQNTDESRLPLMGVLGAFVFAAQMINFPVGAGTSGHLVGGALLAVALGPASACMVMTAILAVQAFVFQDGGILSLGANVLNMAVAGVLAGYWPYKALGAANRSAAIFAAGFLSLLTSACLALSELLLSGVRMPGAVLAGSIGLFAVSAVVEGIITVAAVAAIDRLNPKLIAAQAAPPRRAAGWIGSAAILLAAVGILFASASPDGLERLAADIGIASRAVAVLPSPAADYQFAGAGNEWLRKAGAGLTGVGLVYAASAMLSRWMRRRSA